MCFAVVGEILGHRMIDKSRFNVWIYLIIPVVVSGFTYITTNFGDVGALGGGLGVEGGVGETAEQSRKINFAYTLFAFAFSSVSSWVVWRFDQISTQNVGAIKSLTDSIVAQGEYWSQGIVDTGETAYRILRCDPHLGLMHNDWKIEAKRNVVFNILTAQTIINSLNDSSLDGLSVGIRCGEKFGGQVAQRMDVSNLKLLSLLEKWSKYDSMAGFGRFHFDFPENNDSIFVILKNSFLSGSVDAEKGSSCRFLTGYIQGVFDSIPELVLQREGIPSNADFSVIHENEKSECCNPHRKQGQGCVWKVTWGSGKDITSTSP